MKQYNVAQGLAEVAARAPYRRAIVFPAGRDRSGRARFTQLSYQQFNQECDRYAHGLQAFGIRRGERTLMMVRPGIELLAVAFALVKMGAVPVFIDPGMGRKGLLQCIGETEPTAFIGIPLAHLLRKAFPAPFRHVQHSVIVGSRRPLVRWLLGDSRCTVRLLDEIRSHEQIPFPIAPTTEEDEAAIAFTSGSTGLPKGVVFLHGMFRAQVELIHDALGYGDGEVDLPGLYIFALFNPALGATTIIPDMDPTRSAQVDPASLVEAIQTHGVTTSFGSPTIWKRVAAYCLEHEIRLGSMKRVVMAGAAVPPPLIAQFAHILEDGDVYTPFGATEALPITMMSGREILAETAALTAAGKGMCVGQPTRGNTIRIIPIVEEPIPEWKDDLALPPGEVGEIAVKGPVVTRAYLNRPQQTAQAKIREGDEIWHRMGDLGYFDEQGRLWFCGRKSHRVETAQGLMLPDPCEAIFDQHPGVARTALVGVGERGRQRPVLVVEPRHSLLLRRSPAAAAVRQRIASELLALAAAHEQTQSIRDVLFYPSFPVDVRHNVKIDRLKLGAWAAEQLRAERIRI